MAVVLGCLAQIVSACGCPDDRLPSGIEMTLPASLGDGAYRVEICVDSTCEVFDGVQQGGTVVATGDGEVELEVLRSDLVLYTSWRQITPGTHAVVADLSDGTGTFAVFDGSVEFEEIDRCHAEDSEASIELAASG